MLPLFVILPLFSAFIISIFGRVNKYFGDIFANFTNILLVFISFLTLYLLNINDLSAITYNVGGWRLPIGITLVVDYYSALMLIIINLVSFFVSVYSISYMEKYTDKTKYYVLFMLMLSGMNGVVISGDLFNIFVFLEVASISSYSLVAFGVESEELEAAFKYLVLGTIASSLILLSIAIIYSYASSLNLAHIALIINRLPVEKVLLTKFVIILLIVGFCIKSAVVPFHSWLPDAHPSAPAPISAMLSGILIKTLGIYTMTRIIFNVFFVGEDIFKLVYWLGIVSMLAGVIIALYQLDYKRLLAYSSISHVGYILLGIGLGTPLGILGGIFHLLNHSVIKSLLFLTSGSLEYSLGTRDLLKISQTNQRLPITKFAMLIGSLSISGVPPFNGFWSKLIIIIACVQSKKLFAGFVAILVSVLTLSVFIKVLKYGFYKKSLIEGQEQKSIEVKDVPFWMKFSMLGLALLCVFMGILIFPNIRDVLLVPASDILARGYEYSKIVFMNK